MRLAGATAALALCLAALPFAAVADGQRLSATIAITGQIVPTAGIPATGDEFVGPFASWYNVKLLASQTDAKGLHGCPSNTVTAAFGDGSHDDTTALQHCLNDMGSGSNGPVIWVPSGTYKITATLTVVQRLYASMIGEDPASTSIQWAGSAGGTMLYLNGWVFGRIDRLTFDGSSSAAIAVDQSWDGTQPWFDTDDQYLDDVFKNAGYGIRGGALGAGFASIAIIGAQFTNLTTACLSMNNFNALAIWVRYSLFDHCRYGVETPLGGNYSIYNSNFLNSSLADVFDGVIAPISIRQSYSFGSNRFYDSGARLAPAPLTLQGNTIVNPVQCNAINVQHEGPLILYDNVVRSLCSAGPVVQANTENTDIVAVGNTFTATAPINAGSRLANIDTTITPVSVPSTPILPPVQPNFNRQVFEVAPGASTATIQAQINAAAAVSGMRPIVHFRYGTYSLTGTLTIQANADLQIVGDGLATTVNGTGAFDVFTVNGPTKATFRDIHIDRQLNTGDGILANNLDQVGSRVFGDMVFTRGAYRVNVWSDHMDNTAVIVQDYEASNYNLDAGSLGVYVAGGALAAAGTPAAGYTFINGANKTNEIFPWLVYNNGALIARDQWYESSPSAHYLDVLGKGRATFDDDQAGTFTVNSLTPPFNLPGLDGNVSLLNMLVTGPALVSGDGTNANVLVAGLTSENIFGLTTPAVTSAASPAGTVGMLESRDWNLGPVANTGTTSDTFVRNQFAQTRATTSGPLTALPNGVSDLRLFRVMAENAATNLHFIGGAVTSPFARLSATPGSVTTGESATLTWSAPAGATSCAGTGFSAGGAISGTASVSPTVTTTYSVACTGSTGLTFRIDQPVEFVPVGTNFVTNGTFESPGSLAAPWTDFGSGATVVAANARSATHSGLATNAGGFQGLFQDIQGLTPNTSYDLKGWASKTTAGTPGNSCFIGAKNFSSGPAVNAEITGGGTYAQYAPPTFTTDGVHSAAQIYVFCDTGVANFDDITVTLH